MRSPLFCPFCANTTKNLSFECKKTSSFLLSDHKLVSCRRKFPFFERFDFYGFCCIQKTVFIFVFIIWTFVCLILTFFCNFELFLRYPPKIFLHFKKNIFYIDGSACRAIINFIKPKRPWSFPSHISGAHFQSHFKGRLIYGKSIQFFSWTIHAATGSSGTGTKRICLLRLFRHVRNGDEPSI